MTWIDLGIILIITISALISLYRGFVKEFISLAAWVMAVWVAINYADQLALYLPEALNGTELEFGSVNLALDNLRIGIAFIALIVVTLIAGAIVNGVIGALIKHASLSVTDRLMGLVFGVAKGAVIVVLIVMVAGLTQFPKSPRWGESKFIHPFQEIAMRAITFLPGQIAKNFTFE
ncbi:MAG: CvpA family protein [Gammaproteobacteria bacterium]|nr:CvpA family protein [Gammaproteobacteria bacterium]